MPAETDPVADFLADVRMQAEDHGLVPASDVLKLLDALGNVQKAAGSAGMRGPTRTMIATAYVQRAIAEGIGGVSFAVPVAGVCPACGRTAGLRKDGLMEYHRPVDGWGNCDGVVQPPAAFAAEGDPDA
jgi:hypothetical protein